MFLPGAVRITSVKCHLYSVTPRILCLMPPPQAAFPDSAILSAKMSLLNKPGKQPSRCISHSVHRAKEGASASSRARLTLYDGRKVSCLIPSVFYAMLATLLTAYAMSQAPDGSALPFLLLIFSRRNADIAGKRNAERTCRAVPHPLCDVGHRHTFIA